MSNNAEGWIRHCGGKCPVDAGVEVGVRLRDGTVFDMGDSERADFWDWGHTGIGGDLMAYRIHKPIEETADDKAMRECVEKCASTESLDASSYTIINDFQLQKIGQIEGPIMWRDRITEIDSTTQALTAERAELVQKLASEGFALIGRINDLLTDAAQKHEDMSDPKNWRNGDIVECIVDHEDYFTAGSRYVVDYMECDWVNIHADDDGDENAIRPHKVKFHSRPSA